jgi:hypothetical protein
LLKEKYDVESYLIINKKNFIWELKSKYKLNIKLNMKNKLLFYYTNSKSVMLIMVMLLMSSLSFAQNINIAPLATASASTCNSGTCAAFNDLNFGTCGTQQVWLSSAATNPGSAVFIQFTWSSPQVIRGITIQAGESGNRFLSGGTIQAWNGSTWVTVTTFTQANINVCNYDVNFLPVSTTQLRIIDLVVAGAQSTNVNFREIEIWQGSIANNDIGVASIDSPTTFCINTQNIVARVVNYGTNQVTGFNVNWSINGVTQTPIASTALLDTAGGTNPNNTQILLGSYNFPNGVITQIKAWTSNPNNTNDTIYTNDSTTVYKSPAMSGTYTIGATGTYLTINDAVADLKIKGICGPVVFNVTNATYTGQVIIDAIAGTSPTNTITFNGNGSTITGSASPLMSLNNVSYIIIDSFNIIGSTGFAGTGVHVTNQCHHLTFDANTINVGTTSTSTTNMGFAASGSPTGATTTGNNAQYITFTNNTIIGGYYSATFIGNTGYSNNFGHYIANNTFRDFYLYGVYFLHADSSVFIGNDINRASRTTLSTLYGLYIGTSRFIKAQKNKLHDFGAASYSAYPIYIVNSVNSTGYETEISNNTIYNIGQTAGIFYGIYSLTTAINKVNIYHNTIAYNVPTASTSAIRGLFLSVAITDVNVRNNIINITGGGTGVKTGIYITTTSTSFTSNNNNIIVATTSNNNVGYWTATRATLANWQTASGQDLNSNDINPQFTNLALGNLKPLSIPLDNLGFAVGVTSDIDNSTRSLSTPDIGAYEFATAVICSGTPEAGVATSSRSYACSNQNFTLSLDSASVGLGLTYQWLVSTTGANGTYTPLINDTLKTFDRAQTTTSWYKCVMICQGTNRDTSSVINVRTTTTPFSGVYTLNKNAAPTTTNYTNFETLIEELSCVGVTGPVTINVVAGSGPYNAGITFGNIPNASATNSVTFNGNGNTITGSVSPLVTFSNASFITLDSFNIVGSTGFAGFGVYFSNQSRNITLNKNTIDVGTTSTSTTNAGIVASGSATAVTTAGNNAQYLTITNNEVIGGYYSMVLTGTASYLNNFGHTISNNTFRDFYLYGPYLLNADTTVLSNNIITRATRSTISTFYGIYLSTARNIKVQNNKIHDAGSGTYTAYPVYVTTSVNSIGFETEFTNNVIYNINTTGTIYGYYLLGTRDGMKFYHNTIDLDLASSTGTIRAVWISTAPNNHDFKNNIISVRGNGTGTKHLIYVTTGSASVSSNYNVLHMGAIGGANHVGFITTDQTTLAAWNTASLLDSNSVAFDPVFTAPASGNHTPLSINVDNIGMPVGITTDFTGNTRSLTTPDAGAYEFTGLSGDISVIDGSLKRSSACYTNVDSAFVTIRNIIGSTADFSINPLTVKWVSTGPVNSNGTIVLTSGTIAPSADTTVWANNVDMSLPGTYNLTVFIEPNAVNASALNDTLFNVASLIVRPILSVTQRNFTVTGPNDTVIAQANSPLFPGGSVFFSEICHFKTTSGQPTLGWPTYLLADDYVELTGVPNSDLAGVIMEEWTGTALQHTVTFPTGTLFGPNGTMVVATGQLGASVPVPGSFYYHSGNTTTHGSGDVRGYVLKNQSGIIIDAVTYGGYVFPAASGVTALDWTGTSPAGTGTSGNRLNAPDNNTASVWVNSATSPQDPNVVNTNVTAPSPVSLTGFNWNYLGSPIDTLPRITLGPWTTPGVYTYVASYTNACGTFYDTVFVTAASTVPVKLTTFTGKANNQNADLMWQTASEKNARLFEVHASVDSKNFKLVGTVKANGNTNSISTYTYTDIDALTNNNKVYYKLKAVDVDGTFEWSKIVIVNTNDANNANIEVYPNPFNNHVTVSLVDNTPATIEVVTMEGVHVYNTTTNNNSALANINLTQLTSGVYFIKVTQNGNTTVQKLVKQ